MGKGGGGRGGVGLAGNPTRKQPARRLSVNHTSYFYSPMRRLQEEDGTKGAVDREGKRMSVGFIR